MKNILENNTKHGLFACNTFKTQKPKSECIQPIAVHPWSIISRAPDKTTLVRTAHEVDFLLNKSDQFKQKNPIIWRAPGVCTVWN